MAGFAAGSIRLHEPQPVAVHIVNRHPEVARHVYHFSADIIAQDALNDHRPGLALPSGLLSSARDERLTRTRAKLVWFAPTTGLLVVVALEAVWDDPHGKRKKGSAGQRGRTSGYSRLYR